MAPSRQQSANRIINTTPPTSPQSSTARARAYSAAVKAAKDANGNVYSPTAAVGNLQPIRTSSISSGSSKAAASSPTSAFASKKQVSATAQGRPLKHQPSSSSDHPTSPLSPTTSLPPARSTKKTPPFPTPTQQDPTLSPPPSHTNSQTKRITSSTSSTGSSICREAAQVARELLGGSGGSSCSVSMGNVLDGGLVDSSAATGPHPTTAPLVHDEKDGTTGVHKGHSLVQKGQTQQGNTQALTTTTPPLHQQPLLPVSPIDAETLVNDGQAWMTFLQQTATQLEQQVALLPSDAVTARASRSLQYSNTSAPEPVQSSNTPTDTPSKTTAAEETAPIHLLLLSDDALPLSTGSFLHGETSGIPAAGLAGEQQRQPAKHSSEDAQGETLTKLLQVLQEGDVVKQAPQPVAEEAAVATPPALLEPQEQPTLKLNPLLAAPSTQQQLPTKADKYKAADTPIVNELLPTSPRSTTTTTTTTAPTDTTDPPTTSVKKQRSIKPLKATPAGSRLIKNAPSKATATVRQLTDALNAGIRVHKHWQRDGRLRHGGRGSHRLVQAGVVDDKVLVEYPSGWWRTPKTSTVESIELSLGEWKTVVILHTNNGVLRLTPFHVDACAECVLGLNTLLHLTRKELQASQIAIHLPWHESVSTAADTPV